MADTTIVNTPSRRADTDSTDSTIGWVIAIVVLAAVLVGGFLWLRNNNAAAPAPGTNIEVTVPPGADTGSGTGTGTGGMTQ